MELTTHLTQARMHHRDVNHERRTCRKLARYHDATIASCLLVLFAGVFAARTSLADQPAGELPNTWQKSGRIDISSQPVVNTRSNPFALPATDLTKPKQPLEFTQQAVVNPFAKPAETSKQPAVNERWLPQPKTIGPDRIENSAPRNRESKAAPIRLPPSVSTNQPDQKSDNSSAAQLKMPSSWFQAIPVATKLESRVIDSMDLGDELIDDRRSDYEATETLKPTESQPPVLTHATSQPVMTSRPAEPTPTEPTLPSVNSIPTQQFSLVSPMLMDAPAGSPPSTTLRGQTVTPPRTAPPNDAPPSYAKQFVAVPEPAPETSTRLQPTIELPTAETIIASESTVPSADRTPIRDAPAIHRNNAQANTPTQSSTPSYVSSTPSTLVSPPPETIPHAISHGSMGRFLDPYRVRASESTDHEAIEIIDPQAMFASTQSGNSNVSAEAVGFDMWWEPELLSPIGFTQQSMSVDVGTLTQTALVSSPYVRALLTKPHIRRSDIVIADTEFDPTVYLEGRFTDTNEPVGSALTTGDNSDRFRDETFTANGGVRKKTRGGAQLELAQRGGFQQNNSTFLDPNPQGTTRLEFNFTQPLMKDRGCAVNNIRVLLAQLDLQISNADVRNDLENHLIEVTRAYWELYEARAQWLQRKRLLDRAQRLHQILQARDAVDSHQRQILRARAALTSRKSDLVRITTQIRDAQSRLRLLTGSQQLIDGQQLELTPLDQPLEFPVEISTRQSVVTALDNRADIAKSLQRIQAVSARVGVARNQVLPKLDLILGTYVAGLDDNRNTFGAWANQFSDGRPTYWAGLAYELPIGNRASNARLNRNRWELSQAMHEFQQATEVAFTEVEVAVRETQTAYNVMVAKKQSIDAAENEVNFLQQRWELLPDPNESAVLLIEDLLDAQERLADEERSFVAAQVAYAMSWIQLRKSMGILLRFDASDDQPVINEANPALPIANPVEEVIETTDEEIPHLSLSQRREGANRSVVSEIASIENNPLPELRARPVMNAGEEATEPQDMQTLSPQAYSTGNGFSLKESLR